MKKNNNYLNRKKRNRASTAALGCITALVFPLSSSALAGLAVRTFEASTGLVMTTNLELGFNPASPILVGTLTSVSGTTPPDPSTLTLEANGTLSRITGNNSFQFGTLGSITVGGTPSTSSLASASIQSGTINLISLTNTTNAGLTINSGSLVINSGVIIGNTTINGGTLVINSGVQIGSTAGTNLLSNVGSGILLSGTTPNGTVSGVIGNVPFTTNPSTTIAVNSATGTFSGTTPIGTVSGVIGNNNAPFTTNPSTAIAVYSGTLVVNDSGQMNWTGQTLSTNPAKKGNYEGLLIHQEAANPGPLDVSPSFAGRVTVSVAAKGAVSGSLDYEGHTYRFAGLLGSNVVYQRTFTPSGQLSTAPVKMTLQWDPATSTIKTSVTRFDAVSEGILELAEFNAKTNPAPQAGRYTFTSASMPSTTINGAGEQIPAGPVAVNGYSAVGITPAGIAIFAGKIKDGKTITCTSKLMRDGTAAFYAPFGNTSVPNGEISQLVGSVNFDKTVIGQLEHYTLPHIKEDMVFRGTVNRMDVDGEVYTAPPTGSRVIALDPNSDKMFLRAVHPSEENPSGSLGFPEKTMTLSVNNLLKVLGPNNERVNLSFFPATGIVRGSVFDKKAGLTRRLEGVVLQGSGMFEGISIGKEGETFGNWELSQTPTVSVQFPMVGVAGPGVFTLKN